MIRSFPENLRSNFLTVPFPFFAYFYPQRVYVILRNDDIRLPIAMKGTLFLFSAIILVLVSSCSHKITADKPVLAPTNFNLDSVPVSEINIPIQISMKPVYALAEKNVD